MKNLIILSLFMSFMFSCNDGGTTSKALDETFYTDPIPSGQVATGTCYQDQYAPAAENIIRKLDIIIVPDTSSSINEERAAIADGFDHFIASLPEEVDYRIGVVLGHSPASSRVGKLYQKGSEPLVLDSELHTVDEIKTALNTKLYQPAGDNASDGGEMGMLSLMTALDDDHLGTIQSQGLFRDDAALAVIFVADENDICAEFPEGVTPVPDPQGGEDNSFANYCVDGEGNYLITPKKVVDRLKEVKGNLPMVVGGIIYNNAQTLPQGGENEIGYGYKETIEVAGGLIVDLADGNYGTGLTNLGKMAQVSVKPESEFNLASSKVDPSTIEVFVNNIAAPFSYHPELNQVELTNERDDFSVVKVKYCEKEELPREVMKVIAGGFHTCAILLDGKVKCWGKNDRGQLGQGHAEDLGDNEQISSIEPINFESKVTEMSAGMYHTCAIFEEGNVKCWGANDKGQLGQGHMDDLGDNEEVSTIPDIPLGRKAKKIYSGTYHNCALLDNQSVKCWGLNNAGQLGYGNKETIGDDESLSTIGTVPVGGSVVQMDISTISSHSCAVTVSGNLKCWGQNNAGQLGYGHTNSLGDDESLSSYGYVPFGSQILQLSTGNLHTCALIGGQQIQCWGANSRGQAGYGSLIVIGDDEAADTAPILSTGASGHLMVANGNLHTCALGTNNKVYCWGFGQYGSTGLGHTNNIGDDESIENVSRLALDKEISQVASGLYHSCALTKDEGKVICWGQNSNGQLGLGHKSIIGDNETPTAYVQMLATTP